jgi:hypothetical protein
MQDHERGGSIKLLDVGGASTPVYFAMTGDTARLVISMKYALTAAQTFGPYFTAYGVR